MPKQTVRRGTIQCPSCGAIALRRESRRTLSPKAPKIQLYVCTGEPPHQIEAALYILYTDLLGQPKKLLNRYSTKGARANALANLQDYDE